MSAVPRIGEVVVGRDAVGRVLRMSAHPGNDRVVLSIWQDGACLATVRLAGSDVEQVVRALSALVAPPEQPAQARPQVRYPQAG